MAVTQGLGDGFALYNGVKLPNIDSVWTDKTTYTWVGIAEVNGEKTLFISSAQFAVNRSSSIWITSADCSYKQYGLTNDVWTYQTEHTLAKGTTLAPFSMVGMVWCNGGDVLDENGEVYLEATDPIPLDGMQVIEWDGDTDGLANIDNYYKVSDNILDPTRDFSFTLVTSNRVTFSGANKDMVDIIAGSIAVYSTLLYSVYADNEYGFEKGLYFVKDTNGNYLSLLAYTPAAEPETPKWQFNLRDFLSGMASAAASRGVLRRTNGAQIPNNSKGTTLISVGTPITALLSYMMGYQIGCILRAQREKKPTYQWETLFEGNVQSYEDVDVDPNEYLGAARITMTYPGFAVGERIRLTVNGESTVLTAVYQYSEESMVTYPVRRECVYVGNSDVGGGSNNGFENQNVIDYDYCLLQYNVYEGSTYIPAEAEAYLYTRSEGTYSVKIERAIPVSYEYNGVQLPGLPVVEYPYKVIAYLDVGQLYRVYCCLEKCTVTGATVNFKAPYVWYSGSGDNWEYMGEETSDSTPNIAMVTPIWANHDILQGDMVYLEASEPVPVYE